MTPQAKFQLMLNAPPRPILMALAKRIMDTCIRRGGQYPARWCLSKLRFYEFHLEQVHYEIATAGDPHPSAPIDRSNLLVIGVPVVAR